MTGWLCVLGHIVSRGCTGRLRVRGHLQGLSSIQLKEWQWKVVLAVRDRQGDVIG